MDLGLEGRKALVLGASRGLGRAIADLLVEEGASVVAASRSGEGPAGGGVEKVRLDLSDPSAVHALGARLAGEGGVDILINNSGGPTAGPARGQTADAWESAFRAMASSLFSLTELLLPGMIERRWGRIVTVGSSGIVQPIHGLALSNGVRGAIAGWSKTLASEVGQYGITVNMVLPGRIDTDRVKQLDTGRSERTGKTIDAVQAAARAEIPVGRYGRPDEFASVAVFLASARASYVNGSMVRVDGGMIRGL